MDDVIQRLSEAIREAAARKRPLCIRGGGTKDFYGGVIAGDTLDTTAYRGIVAYEPTELVITARAGTPLAEIEAALHEKGQMLAFEPPHFTASPRPSGEGPGVRGVATLGGCVAAGLSGPRRAYAGAVRDFVLGVRLLDGKGTDLAFGGRVMKNVAGYDVSRFMTGSLGTLGLLTEISLKVLPLPPSETTVSSWQNSLPSTLAHVERPFQTPRISTFGAAAASASKARRSAALAIRLNAITRSSEIYAPENLHHRLPAGGEFSTALTRGFPFR